MNGSVPLKRGRGKESDVPMEQRLENLALNQPMSSSQPNGEGLAHLLLQVCPIPFILITTEFTYILRIHRLRLVFIP